MISITIILGLFATITVVTLVGICFVRNQCCKPCRCKKNCAQPDRSLPPADEPTPTEEQTTPTSWRDNPEDDELQNSLKQPNYDNDNNDTDNTSDDNSDEV